MHAPVRGRDATRVSDVFLCASRLLTVFSVLTIITLPTLSVRASENAGGNSPPQAYVSETRSVETSSAEVTAAVPEEAELWATTAWLRAIV